MFAPLFTSWGLRTSFALIFLFSILILMTLWQLPSQWKQDKQWLTVDLTAEKTPVKNDFSKDFIQKIPEAHLFGHALPENAKDLPITSLQFRLIGVIASSPTQLSRIIISEGGQPGKVYRIGDAVGPVKVNAITQNGVILENNGRLEKLPLQRAELSFQGMPKKLLNEE